MAEWKKVIVSGSAAELLNVTASFKGDGSEITGVQASGLNIEGFTDGTSITVANSDKLLLSDAGTEKYINVSQLPFTNDTNTFRTVRVEASTNSTLGSSESLVLKQGSNITLAEDGGTVSISGTPNTQLSTADVRGKISGTGLISYNSSTGVISTTANNYVLPEATATSKGGIELFSNTDQTVAANAVSATAGRTYGLQLNSDGQAVVNVPWSNTNTNRSDASVYALFSGGDNVQISDEGVITATDTNTQLSTSQVRSKISGTGLISYNSSTGVISTTANNYSLPAATSTVRGGIELISNTVQSTSANSVSTTSGRTYGVQVNSAGQAVVNVPWSDTNTDTNTFRGVRTRNGDTQTALGSTETLELKAGTNVSISEAEGVVTFSSTDTNTQLSTADVRGKISGTGLISYNSSTGVISTTANNYTLTAADVKSVLGGGMPSNALTIGDSGDTITIAGNLDVNGTTTTIDTANLAVKDKFIELNSGATTEGDGGIVVNGATNKSFGWDTSAQRWAFDFTGATAGQTTIGSDAYAVAVLEKSGEGLTNVDANYAYSGNMFVNTDEGDIYIYVK